MLAGTGEILITLASMALNVCVTTDRRGYPRVGGSGQASQAIT